jgi:hypothetical protein
MSAPQSLPTRLHDSLLSDPSEYADSDGGDDGWEEAHSDDSAAETQGLQTWSVTGRKPPSENCNGVDSSTHRGPERHWQLG